VKIFGWLRGLAGLEEGWKAVGQRRSSQASEPPSRSRWDGSNSLSGSRRVATLKPKMAANLHPNYGVGEKHDKRRRKMTIGGGPQRTAGRLKGRPGWEPIRFHGRDAQTCTCTKLHCSAGKSCISASETSGVYAHTLLSLIALTCRAAALEKKHQARREGTVKTKPPFWECNIYFG